ncbi:MAG: hypothetical protein JW699_01000 [Chitinispirillaceae bacterium]|nr:hypothetical protein [Chitinispirillaceae bacterium]
MEKKIDICVAGLGCVGLPPAVALAKHFTVSGFDINDRTYPTRYDVFGVNVSATGCNLAEEIVTQSIPHL